MNMFSSIITTKGGTTVKTFLNNELAQVLMALLIAAIYLVEVIKGIGSDQFIAGALVTVVGYYFGGKNSVQSAQVTADTANQVATTTATGTKTNGA